MLLNFTKQVESALLDPRPSQTLRVPPIKHQRIIQTRFFFFQQFDVPVERKVLQNVI